MGILQKGFAYADARDTVEFVSAFRQQ